MKLVSHREKTVLRTVDRALSLLEFVASAAVEPTAKEAATKLGVHVATCYHLVNTLERRGYLVKGPRGSLRLGWKIAAVHQSFVSKMQPRGDFLSVLRNLSRQTEETAYLAGWRDGDVVLEAVVEGPRPVRVTGLYVGLRGDAHCRASGKAILAYLPEDALEKFVSEKPLTARTPNTITNPEELRRALIEVRRQGYALDREEFAIGLGCVAAPYFDAKGEVAGAVTVSAPVPRFYEFLGSLTKAVLSAGEALSRLLGYSESYPPPYRPEPLSKPQCNELSQELRYRESSS